METTDPTTLNRRRALSKNVRSLMGGGLPGSHKRVTQGQLGAIIGVGQRGVSERLDGRVPFDFDELVLIMQAFDVGYDTLFPAPSDLGFGDSVWMSGQVEGVTAGDLIAI